MRRPSNDTLLALAAGGALGALGVLLARWGNPVNGGLCVSCFLENAAAALSLTDAPRMAALRPELPGFVAGSLLSALLFREVRPSAGRNPLLLFLLGVLLIVGSAVFIGCPIRALLRLAAGDLTALAGMAGLASGIGIGVLFLRSGMDLGGATPLRRPFQGWLGPALALGVFAFALLLPGLVTQAATGPGSLRAPLLLSLGAGALLGALAQRSRFCVTGAFANWFLARDRTLLAGLGAALLTAFLLSLATGGFRLSLWDQPGSHPDLLWGFLGMALTGLAAVMAAGCPFRQLVLMGEGKVDAAVTTLGMLAGAALVQSWGIASNAGGATAAGRAAVLAGLLFCVLVARFHREEV